MYFHHIKPSHNSSSFPTTYKTPPVFLQPNFVLFLKNYFLIFIPVKPNVCYTYILGHVSSYWIEMDSKKTIGQMGWTRQCLTVKIPGWV